MERLGYSARWAAHGADVGMLVTESIARKKPPGLVGIHLPFAVWPNTPEERAAATDSEKQMLAETDRAAGRRGRRVAGTFAGLR